MGVAIIARQCEQCCEGMRPLPKMWSPLALQIEWRSSLHKDSRTPYVSCSAFAFPLLATKIWSLCSHGLTMKGSATYAWETGKIKLSSKCLEAEFLIFCWKCQVPDQLTGHCFFPCLKKASLEVKWKGKAIACHLLARSWELFSNEHRSTASTPQCSVVSGRERFNICVSIGERLHEIFL